VVTPSTPIPDGTTVTVTINYTGRPGVHTDGDGSTEGWFRIATAGSEGAFVTTEPVGNDSWMPMNNYPTAKPTYDIYDTTNIGKVAIGPGELVGYTAPVGTTYQPVPAPASNAPDANFPLGSVTWHWHSPEPIASYLVENSIGAYDLSARTSPTSGVQYWEAQASTITAAKKATNKTAMDNQEDIVNAAAAQGRTPYEILIIASMIEREAGVAEDRAKIARVIYNRLFIDMPLAIDASVYYGATQAGLDTSLPFSDLRAVDGPWNTYLRTGLPLTPIANPGRASIQAALNPAPNPAPGDPICVDLPNPDQCFYYCYVLGSEDGSHVFAATSEQHDANVAAALEAGLL
jgi:hypothetical protein